MFPQSLLPKFTNPVTGVQNFLFKILELIGPGQIIDFPRENDGYKGKEYRYLRLVLRPELYKYEVFAFTCVVLYLVWWRVGRSINRAKAQEWLTAALPTLNEQFSLISPVPNTNEFPFVADGADAFLTYASGRRGTVGMHTTLSLLPRHDPINLALGAVVYPLIDLTSEAPADTATITVTLRPEGVKSMSNRSVGVVLEGPSAGEGAGLRTGTWAVLKKQAMNERIKGRWDLSFPSLQPDSSIPTTVSKEFAVMSEAAEITTALLAPATAGGSGLKEILEDAETSSYLKSLVISDLPANRPISVYPFPAPLTITLTLALSTDPAVIKTYLQLLSNLTDLITPATGVFPLTQIKQTTLHKLKAARVAAWKEVKTAGPLAGEAPARPVEASKPIKKEDKKVEEVKKDDLEDERNAGPGFTEEELAAMSNRKDKGKKDADKKLAEEKKRRERERKEKLKQQQSK